jgi:hypothetical protein
VINGSQRADGITVPRPTKHPFIIFSALSATWKPLSRYFLIDAGRKQKNENVRPMDEMFPTTMRMDTKSPE